MEDELDNVSRGEEEWVPLLERFGPGLKKQIDDVEENVTRSDVAMARELGVDPVSGRPVSVPLRQVRRVRADRHAATTSRSRNASLRPASAWTTSTLRDALELFQLRATAGHDARWPADQGGRGPVGPYAQYGTKKYVSLKRKTTRTRSRSSAPASSSTRSRRSRRPHHQ